MPRVIERDKPKTGVTDQVMTQIETAAARDAPRVFVQAVESVAWESQPVEHFMQVIDLAISLGYIPLARQLTEKGRKRFPTNEALARSARALAPPVVRGSGPATSGLADSIRWIKIYAAEYKGQWIAVRAGKLLAAAKSLPELIKAVGGLDVLAENAFVLNVI